MSPAWGCLMNEGPRLLGSRIRTPALSSDGSSTLGCVPRSSVPRRLLPLHRDRRVSFGAWLLHGLRRQYGINEDQACIYFVYCPEPSSHISYLLSSWSPWRKIEYLVGTVIKHRPDSSVPRA